jgi:uncharacterized protein (DUF952 family)
MTNAQVPRKLVYKICTADDWSEACRCGRFEGSADDKRDGFIHLSAAGQVAETARRHFRGKSNLVLVELDVARLGAPLVWEPSRGGELFPHLYAPLDVGVAVSVAPMPLGADGVPVVPGGRPAPT